MIPTEHEYTVATHAAARKLYDMDVDLRRSVFPPGVKFPGWDQLDRLRKNELMEKVLPLVDAALSAIPDRRSDAWPEIRALHEGSTFTADEIYEVLRGKSE